VGPRDDQPAAELPLVGRTGKSGPALSQYSFRAFGSERSSAFRGSFLSRAAGGKGDFKEKLNLRFSRSLAILIFCQSVMLK
jgi:hypothetical protein